MNVLPVTYDPKYTQSWLIMPIMRLIVEDVGDTGMRGGPDPIGQEKNIYLCPQEPGKSATKRAQALD